ncbi:MAG: MoaD/ThiS family protein [Nakamurella sp.]
MAEQAAATIRYFGAARAAAGTAQEQIAVPDAPTIALLLETAVERHGPPLAKVLPRCSYLLDAVAVHDTAAASVSDGQILDILPPFAGG